MKIFFNGWFGGFEDNTNPGLHMKFFLDLFEKIYDEKCEKGNNVDSEILCEFDMLIGTTSYVNRKQWKHSYLFSGESTLACKKENYTCVLWGERNYKNVINIPLFIPYIYTNNFVNELENKQLIEKVPTNDVCVIISNCRGQTRTNFLNKLEQKFKVCYAGGYKNNIGGPLKSQYNSKEYKDFVGNFKFIISMENSREDTYITEKLINGLLANIVPVYWGSEKVYDYINKERFLCLKNGNDNQEINNIITKMEEIKNNDNKWLEIVNENNFANKENKLERNIDMIVKDIKCILNNQCWKHISSIYCINNPLFEPDRNQYLKNLFQSQNINENYINYISPTYKHTITEEIYNNYIKEQQVLNLRKIPMKKGELSLFFNYKAVLEYIVKNYKDGLFLIFESDILIGKHINELNDFIDSIKDKDWDVIHIGMHDNRIWDTPNFKGNTGYSDRIMHNINIEDVTNSTDKYRISRKFYTRCCDSFIWTYNGITTFLQYMNSENNYGVPFDYYMCNFFEKNINLKHYWSEKEFFKQGSNIGVFKTTLQNDIC